MAIIPFYHYFPKVLKGWINGVLSAVSPHFPMLEKCTLHAVSGCHAIPHALLRCIICFAMLGICARPNPNKSDTNETGESYEAIEVAPESEFLQSVGIYWMRDRDAVHSLREALIKLVGILEPFARTVKCLESTQSTPADVYLFWLSVMATYEEIFRNNYDVDGLQLPTDVINEIHVIANARY